MYDDISFLIFIILSIQSAFTFLSEKIHFYHSVQNLKLRKIRYFYRQTVLDEMLFFCT